MIFWGKFYIYFLIILFFFKLIYCVNKTEPGKPFPDNFIWAVGSSAFQIEGATKEDGRGPTIWDHYMGENGYIADNSTAEISCDSYHKYEEDVLLVKNLNVTHYRFSIAWSRIFPRGVTSEINQKGVDYYNNLINLLIEYNVEPIITLHHFDLPLALHFKGGWLNDNIQDWFAEYARFCFQNFGDRVKYWVTFNEPNQQALEGYCGSNNLLAPGSFDEHCSWTVYQAVYNQLIAHGKAVEIYKNEFARRQNGKIGINLAAIALDAESIKHQIAADLWNDLYFGLFAHPIFTTKGNYPPSVITLFQEIMRRDNSTVQRLRMLSQDEALLLRGSADFLGLSYYYTRMVKKGYVKTSSKNIGELYNKDAGVTLFINPHWEKVGDRWITHTPHGLYNYLNYIKTNYKNTSILVLQNGCYDVGNEGLEDKTRIVYMKTHLEAIQDAIEAGANVIGYTAWSLMDSFEFRHGYTVKFGLYHVNFSDPDRARIPKRSVEFYRNVTSENRIGPYFNEIIKQEDYENINILN
uniref:Myrosinase 1-like n=1 Tax=Strongyloides venezuelensis TaxID=75913 RepID=A0A0K0F6M1_STRVS